MKEKKYALGIDTSNYKTSVAIVDERGKLLFNHQQFLSVREGERGLRQSEAVFQHMQNLPPVLERALRTPGLREHIGVVSVSDRPRPQEGSYMPVFTAGCGFGQAVAAALDVPLRCFSHQEGHIEAVRFGSPLQAADPLICFHFSGGTTEALLVSGQDIEIVGGSKDLAYGQVLDRIGVALGYPFPCGEALDQLATADNGKAGGACSEAPIKAPKEKIFTPIKVKDGYVNLSGIETQGQRAIGAYPQEMLVRALFWALSRSIGEITQQLAEKYQIRDFLYAGGVSCSAYLRRFLQAKFAGQLHLAFGESRLSSDNAIGTALLGGKTIWR